MLSASIAQRLEFAIEQHHVPEFLRPHLGSRGLVYQANQKDKAVQTSGPAFAPVMPEIRTEVRREVGVPEQVHIVPGDQCYHVFNPCHAFRHRGTQGRVQTLRICEYCETSGERLMIAWARN